jgi:hypothetical protein
MTILEASALQVEGSAFSASRTVRAPAARRTQWSFQRVFARERPQVEDFIRRRFLRAYRARLSRLMPALMALYRGAEIAAACGLRHAAGEKLFLETYLDDPVEDVLSASAGTRVDRHDILEVGNLAVARAGYARRLIIHLTHHLHAGGPGWVVFTAVPALRNSFLSLGIPLIMLAAADGARLDATARAEWGSYYEKSPQVTAVNVGAAFETLCEAACTR